MAGLSPLQWPVVRQVRSGDLLGRGPAVTSERTRNLASRNSTADRVVQSVCPYCAGGCGQRIYARGGEGGAGRSLESRRRSEKRPDEGGLLLLPRLVLPALGGATLDNEENYLIKK